MNYFGLYKLIAAVVMGTMSYASGGLVAHTNPVPAAHVAIANPGPSEPIYKEGLIYAPVLMYHHIAPKTNQSPYYVSPDIFAQQMAWLHDNGYHVISYEEFYNGVYGDQLLPEKPVVLTFDDGDRDQYLNAVPVMKKYGYTGTFYIITNDVGAGNGFVTWDMLKEMVKDGMDIEDHTVHHPNLAALDETQTEMELGKSKTVLENKLGITVKHLAYPGGAFSKLTIEVAKKLGYLSAVTVNHTQYHSKDLSPYKIGRMHIDSDMESFVGFVTGRREN